MQRVARVRLTTVSSRAFAVAAPHTLSFVRTLAAVSPRAARVGALSFCSLSVTEEREPRSQRRWT